MNFVLLILIALNLPLGEKILMNVYFGPIKAGILKLEVTPKIVEVEGKDCYHVKVILKTTGAFSYFFKVHDEINSYIDTSRFYTIKYTKKLLEGNFKFSSSMTYSPDDSLARYPDTTIKTPPFHDPLSLIYIARLSIGKDTSRFIYHVDKITTTALIIPAGYETIKGRKAEKFVIRFEKGGLFKNGGDFNLWVAKDSAFHEPLKVHSRLKFGSITAFLKKYTPGLYSSKP